MIRLLSILIVASLLALAAFIAVNVLAAAGYAAPWERLP